jgi:hypothetical protein
MPQCARTASACGGRARRSHGGALDVVAVDRQRPTPIAEPFSRSGVVKTSRILLPILALRLVPAATAKEPAARRGWCPAGRRPVACRARDESGRRHSGHGARPIAPRAASTRIGWACHVASTRGGVDHAGSKSSSASTTLRTVTRLSSRRTVVHRRCRRAETGMVSGSTRGRLATRLARSAPPRHACGGGVGRPWPRRHVAYPIDRTGRRVVSTSPPLPARRGWRLCDDRGLGLRVSPRTSKHSAVSLGPTLSVQGSPKRDRRFLTIWVTDKERCSSIASTLFRDVLTVRPRAHSTGPLRGSV